MNLSRRYDVVEVDNKRKRKKNLVTLGTIISFLCIALSYDSLKINNLITDIAFIVILCTLILSALIFQHIYPAYNIVGKLKLSDRVIELEYKDQKIEIDIESVQSFFVKYRGAEQDINYPGFFSRSLRENSGINNYIYITTSFYNLKLNCLFIQPNEDHFFRNYFNFLHIFDIKTGLEYEKDSGK